MVLVNQPLGELVQRRGTGAGILARFQAMQPRTNLPIQKAKPALSTCKAVRELIRKGKTKARQVANEVGVSKRTLQRRLAENGLSFSSIVKEEQMARAITLIANPDSKLGFIARELGYSHPANFVRAFRNWTGVSPSTFRIRNRIVSK